MMRFDIVFSFIVGGMLMLMLAAAIVLYSIALISHLKYR
jgi:hypothetical protein